MHVTARDWGGAEAPVGHGGGGSAASGFQDLRTLSIPRNQDRHSSGCTWSEVGEVGGKRAP